MKVPGLLALREAPAEVLVNTFEHQTAELFGAASRLETPDIVVIPACNEERDIPATLLSLSRSIRPVIPIVVENGSDAGDKTHEYASRMGAIALQCEPAKMRATQVGLAASRKRFPKQRVIHFGDGDDLYPKVCVAVVSGATQKANEQNDGNGALMFSLGLYEHGPSLVVDIMRSGRLIRKAVRRKLTDEHPMLCGCNYALHIGKDEDVVGAIGALNPLLFVREESVLRSAALASGVAVGQLIDPRGFVFTRGDLIRNREEWREFKGATMETKAKYYKRTYPNIPFLPDPNGRGQRA